MSVFYRAWSPLCDEVCNALYWFVSITVAIDVERSFFVIFGDSIHCSLSIWCCVSHSLLIRNVSHVLCFICRSSVSISCNHSKYCERNRSWYWNPRVPISTHSNSIIFGVWPHNRNWYSGILILSGMDTVYLGWNHHFSLGQRLKHVNPLEMN